jgi:hypothetical protein
MLRIARADYKNKNRAGKYFQVGFVDISFVCCPSTKAPTFS